jgi:hypothetical protein
LCSSFIGLMGWVWAIPQNNTLGHPAGGAELDTLAVPGRIDLGIELWMPDRVPSRDDRIGEALPDHGTESPRGMIPRGPADMDHGVAPAGKPIDVHHLAKLDGDNDLPTCL